MSALRHGPLRSAWYLGRAWFKVNVMRERVPLLMSWNLTFRCNLRCQYCSFPAHEVDELSEEQAIQAIDDFYELGTRWITFSGGEPLLRKDMPRLVAHAKQKGIVVFISTNGWLVPKYIKQLQQVDRFTISLDGGREVHDRIRGNRAFDKAVAGIKAAQEHGIPVALTCVLSKLNLDSVEEVLDLARELGVTCMFQPATKWLHPSPEPNPIAPETEPYRQAMDRLITLKRKGAPITNSTAGLIRLQNWPDPIETGYTAGRIIGVLEADGKVLASSLHEVGCLDAPVNGSTPKQNYLKMALPEHMDEPWCGPALELDLLFNLNPSAILNALAVQR